MKKSKAGRKSTISAVSSDTVKGGRTLLRIKSRKKVGKKNRKKKFVVYGPNGERTAGDGKVGKRIALARAHGGFDTQTALAKRLGVSRSAVNEWERGGSEPSGKQMRNIALVCGVNYDWLGTGRGKIDQKTTVPAASARLIGIVQAEIWREGVGIRQAIETAEDQGAPIVPCVPRFGFAEMRQFAFEMKGFHADQTIQPGEFVICAAFNEARPGGPQPNDLVVVEKTRGTEHKTVVMRLKFRNEIWELNYESNDPLFNRLKPIQLSPHLNHDRGDGKEIDILGLVLGVYRDNPMPRFGQFRPLR